MKKRNNIKIIQTIAVAFFVLFSFSLLVSAQEGEIYDETYYDPAYDEMHDEATYDPNADEFYDPSLPAPENDPSFDYGSVFEDLQQQEEGFGANLGVPAQKTEQLSLTMTPKSPGPKESVTAKITSSLNLNSGTITWYENGVIKLTGAGKTNYSFTTKGVGEVTSIRVVVAAPATEKMERTLVVRPVGVDMVWEAESLTPPFYKGKALASSQSNVRVIALANFLDDSGRRIPPEDLVYTWKKGYKTILPASGLGRSSYVFKSGYTYNNDLVQVTVATADKTLTKDGQIEVPVVEPKIIFYEKRPLEGVRYEQALGDTVELEDSELVIAAEPYYFSFFSRGQNEGNYEWRLDGRKSTAALDDKSEIILRKPEAGQGRVKLDLSIKNPASILQSASQSVSVFFTF